MHPHTQQPRSLQLLLSVQLKGERGAHHTAAKYITGVCDIAVKHFGVRVHSWHEMNEAGDERLRRGWYDWKEVHEAWKQVKVLDEQLPDQVPVDRGEQSNVNN